jgi:hypothetical protein
LRKLFLTKKYAYICLNKTINDKKVIKKQKPLIQVSARISEELLSVHKKISKTKKISLSQHIHSLLDNFSDEYAKSEEIFKENLSEKDSIISKLKKENEVLSKNISILNTHYDNFVNMITKTVGLLPNNEDDRQTRIEYLWAKFNTTMYLTASQVTGNKEKHIKK